MTGIIKKHIKMGLEKCKEDRFVMEDIIIDKLITGNGASNSAITKGPADFKKVMFLEDKTIDDVSTAHPRQYVISHKTALLIHGGGVSNTYLSLALP